MKNDKKKLYILLPLVVAIWGYFGYQLYKMMGDEEEYKPMMKTKTNYSDTIMAVDTFSILARYRDPFLGSMAAAKPAADKSKINIPKAPPKEVKVKQWPSVIYYGQIKKKNTDKLLIALQVNGRELLLKNGETTADGITVVNVYRDSVQLLFEKDKRTFKK